MTVDDTLLDRIVLRAEADGRHYFNAVGARFNEALTDLDSDLWQEVIADLSLESIDPDTLSSLFRLYRGQLIRTTEQLSSGE